jgi:hypothetical protein
MKLRPYPTLAERRRKALKHVFLFWREAWWALLGGMEAWTWDRRALDMSGALNPEGHLLAPTKALVATVLDRNHAGWLQRAEEAVDEARAAGRVYDDPLPGRKVYVGDRGVTVVVARSDLGTCFRPNALREEGRDDEALRLAVDRACRRAGVRRATRRASLGQDGYAPPVEGHEP